MNNFEMKALHMKQASKAYEQFGRRAGIPMADLRQEVWIALLSAKIGFKKRKETDSFENFSAVCVRHHLFNVYLASKRNAELKEAIREQSYLDKPPSNGMDTYVGMLELYDELDGKNKSVLENALTGAQSLRRLAKDLGLSTNNIVKRSRKIKGKIASICETTS